jgi:TolB-like protein
VSRDFEEWLADKRRTLREQAAFAAWECSRMEEADGDRKAAAVMARRALELTPDDETGVRQLMSLLDRQGDRASALRVYADWKARLQAEYGVEPAPETRKLARKVQAARKGESHETPPVPLAPVSEGSRPAEPVALRPAAIREGPRWLAWGGAGVVLLLVALAGVSAGRGGASPIPPRSLAILPPRVIGGTGLRQIADAVAEELTTELILDTALAVRPGSRVKDVLASGLDVEELGRKLGVAYLVDGGVQSGIARIRLTLRLVRGGDAIAIWAGSYDLSDPPTPADLQRLAAEAAQAIRSKLSDEVRPK